MAMNAATWIESPYDWSKDLEQRLALVKPGDTIRGVFLNGILRALRTLGSEEAVRRCLNETGEARFIDFFSYPISMDLRLAFAAAQELSSRYGGMEEALRHLGHQALATFMSTAAGKALLLMAQDNPKRLLDSLPSAYRASVNYGKPEVTWLSPKRGRLTLQHNFLPWPYHVGVIEALLESMETRNIRVRGRPLGLLHSEYEFSWD